MKLDLRTEFASFRRLEALLPPRAQPVEDAVADAATEFADSFPEDGPFILWGAVRQHPEVPAVARALSFGLASHADLALSRGLPILLSLVSPPYLSDLSSLLNVLTALRHVGETAGAYPDELAPGITGFLRHCAGCGELAEDAVLELLSSVYQLDPGFLTPEQGLIIKAIVENISRPSDDPYSGDIAAITAGLQQSAARPRRVPQAARLEAMRRDLEHAAQEAIPTTARRLFRELAEAIGDEVLRVGTANVAIQQQLAVQSLRIARRRVVHVALSTVNAISEAWGSFIEAGAKAVNESAQLFAVGTATGSFVFRIAMSDAAAGAAATQRLRAVLEKTDPHEIREELKDFDIPPSYYKALLESIVADSADITATGFDAGTDAFSEPVSLHGKQLGPQLEAVSRLVTEQVDTRDIPQADDMHRILRVVALTAARQEITPERLEVVKRQVDYYKQAGRILGLLDDRNELTAAGAQIGRLKPEEQLALACVRFEGSRCGAAWVAWQGVRDLTGVNPESAESFLKSASVLSEETAGRRAQTLKAWHATLVPYHYSRWLTKPGPPNGQ